MNPIKSVGHWMDDRTGVVAAAKPILEHPVPPDTGWWYILGTATLTAFLVQVGTGIALSTSYVTSTATRTIASSSLQTMRPSATCCAECTTWGASAMVVLIGIHMARTFVMGSYKFPREMNWLTGSVLLLVTLAMAFTGQLLRWDQNAVWSTVVAASQAGPRAFYGQGLAHFLLAGDTVGGATLSRFFAFHVFFIPAVISSSSASISFSWCATEYRSLPGPGGC